MAYQKQTWTDRNVETPRTYTMVENQDGTVTLIPAPGTVTAEGTPVSAARMNHIEDGIDGAVCKSGDTMTGWLGIQNETYQLIIFKNNNGVEISHVRGESKEEGNRVVFSSRNLTTNTVEDYHLPIATATVDTWYDVLTTKTPVTVAQGGTGKENLADLQSMIFGGYTLSGITAYPTSPGLYRNTGSLSTGMPTGASLYGTLIIIAGGETSYNLHLYADATQDLYYAFTDNVNPPSEWRKVTSTTVASRT